MFYRCKVSEPTAVKSKELKDGVGFYDLENGLTRDLVYVDLRNEYPVYISPWVNVPSGIKQLFTKPEVDKKEPETVIEQVIDIENKVSEEFALKMLAISMNKEKIKDLK